MSSSKPGVREALRYRDYRRYALARFFAMKFDKLFQFLSPVTDRFLSTENEI